MGRRKVFIPELNTLAEAVDYVMTCTDNDAFLRCMDVEGLERLLKTQLEHEKYELAELIKKHIEIKTKTKWK